MLSGNYDLLNHLPDDTNIITGSAVLGTIQNVTAEIAGDEWHSKYLDIYFGIATIYAPLSGQNLNDFVTGGSGCPNCSHFKMPKGKPCSFSYNTLVSTVNGLQAIGTLSEGEYVLAYDETTGEIGYYPITAVWSHEDTVIVHLIINGEHIETTPEHPFYMADGEWRPAATLQVGTKIRTATGDVGVVEVVRFVHQPQTMYNFTVATAHTYFIGYGQWLVHNACPFDSNTLYHATQLSDRNGFTGAGRALQKHANRSGSSWQPYLPSGTKNPTNYNRMADSLVMDMLTSPNTTYSFRYTKYHGWVHEFYAPDRRGLRFNNGGEFMGFLN